MIRACAGETGVSGNPLPYLAELRQTRPRVHVIIGAVTAPFVVDVLAAIGAQPTVTHEEDQAAEFTASADSLFVSLAQLDEPRKQGARAAVAAARERSIPWLLDPAMVHRSKARQAFAQVLLAQSPAVVRLNPDEVRALNGGNGDPAALALGTGSVVFATGARPCLTNGGITIPLPALPQLAGQVGYGCALSALIAAFLARCTPHAAIERAYTAFAQAAGQAKAAGTGPASLRTAFVDALWKLGEETPP